MTRTKLEKLLAFAVAKAHEFNVVDTLVSAIGPTERVAIREACRRECGERRDAVEIVTIAKRAEANPRVVMAAFGFLEDAMQTEHFPSASLGQRATKPASVNDARRYVDAINEPLGTPLLDTTELDIIAAFALARTVCRGPLSAKLAMLTSRTPRNRQPRNRRA